MIETGATHFLSPKGSRRADPVVCRGVMTVAVVLISVPGIFSALLDFVK